MYYSTWVSALAAALLFSSCDAPVQSLYSLNYQGHGVVVPGLEGVWEPVEREEEGSFTVFVSRSETAYTIELWGVEGAEIS